MQSVFVSSIEFYITHGLAHVLAQYPVSDCDQLTVIGHLNSACWRLRVILQQFGLPFMQGKVRNVSLFCINGRQHSRNRVQRILKISIDGLLPSKHP